MAKMSNYLENIVLNLVLNNTAYSQPATVYMALYTTDPTDADIGTEVSGGSYARVVSSFGAAVSGISKNDLEIAFPVTTATWGTVTHMGIRDALTGGNLLFHAPLTTAKVTAIDEQIVTPVNSLTVSID